MNSNFLKHFLILSISLYTHASFAIIEKNFFLRTLSYLEMRNANIKYDFITENIEQKLFFEKMKQHNFEDLFKVKSNDEGIENYNILNTRSLKQFYNDSQFTKFSKCSSVYSDSSNNWFEKKLTNISNISFFSKKKNLKFIFSYCLNIEKKVNNNKFFYFFHGASGSPLNWHRRKAITKIRELWRKETNKVPIWISISLGRFHILAKEEQKKIFFRKIIPYIENQIATDSSKKIKRVGLGVSLGGANAIQILLNNKSFFKKVFLVCPAISTINKYSNTRDIELYSQRTHALKPLIKLALYLSPNFNFSSNNQLAWEPLILGQKKLSYKSPPIYIQTSSKDEFGFQEGGKLFTILARTSGVNITFEELQGRHCVLKPHSVINFLNAQ